MYNRFTFIALSFLTLFGQSCSVTYGDRTNSSFTKIETQKPCKEKASHVYLFYEGEAIDFNYKKLGEVEVKGGDFASNREVMDYLKLKAWSNCANGLIHIQSGYIKRTKRNIDHPELDRDYNAKYYKALAVNIEMDSAFIAKYGMKQDTAFVNRILKSQEEETRKESNQLVGSFLIGTAVVLGYVLIKISETK